MINSIDVLIKRELPATPMSEPVELTIEYICGFELFNTSPYHNYETWSSGYRVTGHGIKVEREHLDEAVSTFFSIKATKNKEKE